MRIVLPQLLTLCVASSLAAAQPRFAESDNFVVRSLSGAPSARQVLSECRSLHGELHALLHDKQPRPWRPRCEVVVHNTRRSYAAAVGRAGFLTQGSSLTEVSAGRVTRRRIDLLADEAQNTPALAHELMHIILAEFFDGRPPRWADEGLALLVDSAHKQRMHLRDLAYAVRSGTALRVVDVLTLDQIESPEIAPAFYAQSLSLVRFLVQRGDHQQFSEFVGLATERGYDHALSNTYEIDDVAHLERLWRDSLGRGEGARVVPVSHSN